MKTKKKKKFLKIPQLEGGNVEFRKFIDSHLIYPAEAIKNNIEGVVHLVYDVDDSGNVFNAKIEKSLGYGCDEEALRLVKLQKFSKVYNQGMRVKISQKAKINFKIKKAKVETSAINYTVVADKNEIDKTKVSDIKQTTYTYTVKI